MTSTTDHISYQKFLKARNFLLDNREDYLKAYGEFTWPQFDSFNWALDWFDRYAEENHRVALWIIGSDGHETKLSFNELKERSSRVASFLAANGLLKGERILVMLPNLPSLWEIMLGAIKMGAVLVPVSPQISVNDLKDRIGRANIKWVVTNLAGAQIVDSIEGQFHRCLVDGALPGWISYQDHVASSPHFFPSSLTSPNDPLLLYFTSGTTAKPKMVLHTHMSYPVGHLSTMYWIGIREGDIHYNISSPGWAKHAWSSFFAPWNAGATVFIHDFLRFSPKNLLNLLHTCGITTLCAPPTIWRMLILQDLKNRPDSLRELVSAGEPLNPEVIDRVKNAWGLFIRDGYGQTETTAQVGNTPGQMVMLGSMGRALPGFQVNLRDAQGRICQEGEITISTTPKPTGLMNGYLDDSENNDQLAFYRTGDEARQDAQGYFYFIGRGDDVFKSSDYRISPFELENVLIEHPLVAEAAVVPSPDPVRLSVPKAYIVLKPHVEATIETAADIFKVTNSRLSTYQKIRKIEFAQLPKTISGKIRRVQLRNQENEPSLTHQRRPDEYWLEDLV